MTLLSYIRTYYGESPSSDFLHKILYRKTLVAMSEIGAGVAGSRTHGRRVGGCLYKNHMAGDPSVIVSTWRNELPVLAGRIVALREPTVQDLKPLINLLSVRDATRFGIDESVSDVGVQELIERAARERAAGASFTYAIVLTAARAIVGLAQVRQ